MVERITCQELTELVNDYVEGVLGAHETALFEQHLNFCDGCDWYVEQIRTTIAASGRITEADVPAPALAKLLTAFRDRGRA
jgi:anti-sigma factor RsiW